MCANCKFARTKDCKSSQTKDGVTICDSINRTTTLIQGIGFNYKSKAIRKMQDEKGEPWFVGKDVAKVLGYKKTENALTVHVDKEDKTTTLIQGTGSNFIGAFGHL